MPGELWRSAFQIAKEATYGTDLAATRKMYFRVEDSVLTREQEPRPYRFATGTRDNQRGFTLGPESAGGSVSMPLSSSEILELLLMTVRGGVTPTTPAGATAAREWTFSPSGAGAALDSATIEWHDGARAWAEHGCYGDTLRLSGAVDGENLVTCELFGATLLQEALTAALPERTPDFVGGWETALFVDGIEGPAGTTEEACTLISWDVTLGNNLGRAFAAHNSQAACAILIGELTVEATLVVEASQTAAGEAFDDWRNAVPKLVSIVWGDNEEIEAGQTNTVTLNLPLYWTAVDLGGSADGRRTYELRGTYVYDADLGYGVQIVCKNARTTAWGA